MRNTNTKHIYSSLIILSMLTACGGGSNSDHPDSKTPAVVDSTGNSNGNNNSANNQTNNLTFPASVFVLDNEYNNSSELFYFNENKISLRNNQLENQHSIPFKQNGIQITDANFSDYDYILTKNKLYSPSNSIEKHQTYLLKNEYPNFTYSYDSQGDGLTETIEYRKIDLSNQNINNAAIINSFFYDEEENSAFKSDFNKLTQKFSQGAACYQYLSSKYNQISLSFDQTYTERKTLDQWISDKKQQNLDVIQENWAGYTIAYTTKVNSTTITDDSDFVVLMNGVLYFADYESNNQSNLAQSSENQQAFKNGICDIYNESAANTLRDALQTLPKY